MSQYNEQLKTWRSLNEFLKTCTEEQALAALEEEKVRANKRPYFVLRVYARFNSLREQRERTELMRIIGEPTL